MLRLWLAIPLSSFKKNKYTKTLVGKKCQSIGLMACNVDCGVDKPQRSTYYICQRAWCVVYALKYSMQQPNKYSFHIHSTTQVSYIYVLHRDSAFLHSIYSAIFRSNCKIQNPILYKINLSFRLINTFKIHFLRRLTYQIKTTKIFRKFL